MSHAQPERRSVTDVIDDLGFGGAQLRVLCFGSGSTYVSAIAMTLFETLPSAIAVELGLHAYERALIFSACLAGKMAGNLFGMATNTLWGRRLPILCGYSLIFTFLPIIPLCYNFSLIVALIFCCSLGPGISTVHLYALLSEASSTKRRFTMNSITNAIFCIGCMQVLAIEYAYSSNLQFGAKWREIVWWSYAPALFLIAGVLMFGFVDSAHVYVCKGMYSEARKILETMREQNGRPDVSIDFSEDRGGLAVPVASTLEASRLMFGWSFCGITLVMCMLTFTLNFSYYGVGYAMPMVLQDIDLHIPPAAILLIIPLIEIAGYISCWGLRNWIGRRAFIMGFLSGGLLTFMAMAYGLFKLNNAPYDSTGQILVLSACFLFKFILAHGWTIVYLYLSEVYPTVCRGAAVGFCIAFGRLGSISTPFVFEHLKLMTGQHIAFFIVVVGMMILDAIASFFILPETKGKKLQVFADETTPLRKYSD